MQQLTCHPVKLRVVHRCPHAVFITRIVPAVEEIEITLKMIGQNKKPKLLGGPDIKHPFEPELSGCWFYFFGRPEPGRTIIGLAVGI